MRKIFSASTRNEYIDLKKEINAEELNDIDTIEKALTTISIKEINFEATQTTSAVATGIDMDSLQQKQGHIHYINQQQQHQQQRYQQQPTRSPNRNQLKHPKYFNPSSIN